MHTSVNAEYKRRRTRGWNAGQFVLARGKLGNQFGGEIRLADILGIVRWKMIPRQAKWTDPQLGTVVYLTIGIQHRMASGGGASNGIVLKGGRGSAVGRELFEGGVERADGGDAAGGFEAGGRPTVEGEAGSAGLFRVSDVPVLALHLGVWLVWFRGRVCRQQPREFKVTRRKFRCRAVRSNLEIQYVPENDVEWRLTDDEMTTIVC